jgi:hypothetical protein
MNLTRRDALAAAGAGLAVALSGGPAKARPAALTERVPVTIRARPIASLLPRQPELARFGALSFRGGLELTGDIAQFGGFSGLARPGDGRRLVAVSDAGHWLTADIAMSAGRLAGLANAAMAPVLNGAGRALATTRAYDTEGLCLQDGVAFVPVERTHEIWRFDFARRGVEARGASLSLPREVKALPRNRGIEAIGVTPRTHPLAGALVAISERSDGHDEPTAGFLIGGPSPGLFRYRLIDGFEVTDLAFLPDGDMLVLERWYRPWRGVGCRIRRVTAQELKPGAEVTGPLLLDIDLGHEIDNMEGLSIHQEAGRTILTLISDDNFSAMQRTLLLEFVLEA